jgi:hypothetical protein
MKIIALILALSWVSLGVGHAGEKVRVALYFAENTLPDAHGALASEGLTHRLHEVFGYKHYELVKEEDIELHKSWANWFVPRKDFFVRIEPLPRRDDDDERQIDYEIYKDGFILAKGRYEPSDETPLFINGPDFNQGRFVLVIESR